MLNIILLFLGFVYLIVGWMNFISIYVDRSMGEQISEKQKKLFVYTLPILIVTSPVLILLVIGVKTLGV